MSQNKFQQTDLTRFSRRNFLRFSAFAGALTALLPLSASIPVLAAEQAMPKNAAKKPLVVYFSQSGHTKTIAEDIQKMLGADIVRIEPENAYPENYDDLTKQAKKEQNDSARPAIKTKIPNLDDYGVIFLGYPNWWSSMPMPVYTFVEQSKLDGKTIAPFCTHGGGGLGHSVDDLKRLAPHSKVLKPLAVPGNRAASAEADVKKWLEGLGTALIETTTGNTKIYPDGAY